MFQMKWIWNNLKGYRVIYILALCITVCVQTLYLTTPIFSQRLVDTFLTGENALVNLETRKGYLIELLILMVATTFLRTVLQYSGNMCYETSTQGMVYKIRNHLFKTIQNQDMDYYNKYRTGDLMTRLTGDLDMVRHCMAWIIKSIVECICLVASTSIYFLLVNWKMALCLLVVTPFIFLVTQIFKKKIRPMYVDLRERLSQMNTAAQENISGNRVVKAFAREDYEIEKFQDKNKDFSEANKKTSLMWIKFMPIVDSLAESLNIVMLLCGGIFLIKGWLTMGEYIAFSGLIWTLSNPIRQFGMVINDLQRFTASSQKIIEIYYSKPSIVDSEKAVSPEERLKGEIEFKNVSFGYDDKEILHDLSFKIKAGETVAIMGETGSGKTTLINLIPRFYDVTKGEILVDGVNVKKYKLKELRSDIGMATQDVLLYSDTIDGNIAYGDSDMPEEEVTRCAELAAAHDFIEKLPEGYNTIIGERGVGLSGGQKQRISLARALAIKPSVLILDDTTSAVDMETEAHIQESLENLDFDCTKIIIAQRISSTKDADKIIILQDGRITEMGTHDELLKNKDGYYHEVFTLQNEGFDDKTEERGND
ncbi:MAG: ABC transporter ATP-binding protein [Ruminococcus sp.]|nr:ABC transporter ATP-binding protein [Ruminococcus sp.]